MADDSDDELALFNGFVTVSATAAASYTNTDIVSDSPVV